jgi:CRP/FNR family cyclic AMP-dependent transcriptional regulator
MIGYRFLKSHCLFGGLSEEEVNILRPFLKEELYSGDDEIVKEGDRGDRLYFIYEGSVEVIKSIETRRGPAAQRIATLGVGDTFGEMELLDVQPSIATIRALEPTAVLTLSNMDLYRISKINLKTYTMVILNLARAISRRLRRMDALVASSLFAQENSGRDISSC